MATEAADADLLRQVRDGRTDAYTQIFKRHRDHAFGLAYYYTKNKEDALDVVQDAFIKAYQNLSKFDFKREFGPWLLTIVRNQAIDHLRKRNRRKAYDLPEVLPDRGAQRRTERGLLRMEIRRALDKLPPEQREIIYLKDYQGHSYAEIAEIQAIPLGTVMSRLHHARKKLIHYLDDSDA
ncbi:MAG TPA: RNA polymerase sigma factor [Acidobacteriota bacterium]|nr:RNA polymerase sigma factor [Acidobacteriota bacterium]